MIALLARRLVLAGLVFAALAAPAAAAPRDELLRYIPDDIGFCLLVQDLRGHAAQVLASPFGQAFGKSALAAAIVGSKEWKQLADAEQFFKKHLGVGWADLRDDIFGDAFAFAYRPGPPGKPEQEQGLFLLRARE